MKADGDIVGVVVPPEDPYLEQEGGGLGAALFGAAPAAWDADGEN